jgi:O-antigen/teichoic acid export membrane protein
MLPVYTRYLTTGQYGAVDLLIVSASLFTPVVTWQAEAALFRFLVDARADSQRQAQIVSTAIFTAVPAATAACAALAVVGAVFHVVPLLWLAAYGPTMVVAGLAVQTARGLGRKKVFAASSLVGAGTTVALNLYLVVGLHLGAAGLVLSLTAANLAVTAFIATRLPLRSLIRPGYYRPQWRRPMFRYAGPLVPSAAAWWVINASDRVIIAVALTVSATGVYGVANRFALIMEFIVGVFALAWVETASIHIDAADRDAFFSAVFDHGVRVLGAAALVVLMVTAAVFDRATGVEFRAAYWYIPPLVAAGFCHGLAELGTGVYVATKNSRRAMITSITAAGVNLVLNLTLIWFIGLWAAALSTTAAFALMAALRLADIRRLVALRWDWRPAAALAGAGAAVTWCYYAQGPWWTTAGWGCAVLVGVALNRTLLRRLAATVRRHALGTGPQSKETP